MCGAATELVEKAGSVASDEEAPSDVREIAAAMLVFTQQRLGLYVNKAPGIAQFGGVKPDVHANVAQFADPATWLVEITRLEKAGTNALLERLKGSSSAAPGWTGGLLAMVNDAFPRPAAPVPKDDSLGPDEPFDALFNEMKNYTRAVKNGLYNNVADVGKLICSPDYIMSYPLLSVIQASCLASTPASAAPERLFSVAGAIQTARRSRLSGGMVEALTVLRSDDLMVAPEPVRPKLNVNWRVQVEAAILMLDKAMNRKDALIRASEVGAAAERARGASMQLQEIDEDEDDGAVMEQLLRVGYKPAADGTFDLASAASMPVLDGTRTSSPGNSSRILACACAGAIPST